MVRLISRVGGKASRYVTVLALAGFLASCGGGGGAAGDTVPLGEQDFDLDGIPNAEDPDADGDGLNDLVADPFVDLDSDGFDDFSGASEAQATGSGVEGDNDNDGFTDVDETNVCGGEGGSDNSSVNNPWDDNCFVRRTSIGGQFADSLYAAGIQRVLFCEGFGNAADYTQFADGEYGPASEAAMLDFQRAEGITDDGIVGGQTWGRLRDRLDLIDEGIIGVSPDVYGFADGACAGIPMFYQDISANSDNSGIALGGWELARNVPNADQTVPFSIDEPFGRL